MQKSLPSLMWWRSRFRKRAISQSLSIRSTTTQGRSRQPRIWRPCAHKSAKRCKKVSGGKPATGRLRQSMQPAKLLNWTLRKAQVTLQEKSFKKATRVAEPYSLNARTRNLVTQFLAWKASDYSQHRVLKSAQLKSKVKPDVWQPKLPLSKRDSSTWKWSSLTVQFRRNQVIECFKLARPQTSQRTQSRQAWVLLA